MLRTAVVIDYQNVHLTARDIFNDSGGAHDSLIHPMLFARRLLVERNARQRPGYPHAELAEVRAFRGLPHVDHDWEQHRRCTDQAIQWRRDGADVVLRDLKYRYKRGAGGRPIHDINGKKEPIGPGQEKGIDVLCALACVRAADRSDIDLVILATRDTDLIPVLDELHDLRGQDPDRWARIETAAWFDRGGRSFGNLRATAPRKIWNTNLDRQCYEASLDRNDYR